MAIERIQKVNVGEQVFEQMKQLILNGEWAPGDKIPGENELAGMFGVSRITVRQALQKLNTMGLVETRLGSGTYIRAADAGNSMKELIPTAYLSSSLEEILEFRRIIDTESTRLAASRAEKEDIEELQRINRSMMECCQKKDLEAFARKDSEFHFKIGEMTRNSLLIKTNEILRDVLQTSMVELIKVRGVERAVEYHTLLIEAIAKHEEERAVELLLKHLD